MAGQKISFDLDLSNKIFKANLLSLLQVSKESIEGQREQYELLLKSLSSNNAEPDWLEKSSHYANIDWLLLNSILISSFSFFEHHIFKLCRIVEDKTNSKIQLDDISGKGIFKFCNYLYLVGNIESANKANNDWQNIIFFQKVRNLLAHNGGLMLSDPTKNLENHECYKFLKTHDVIMAGILGHIRIRDLTFIDTFHKLTVNLSDTLTKEISDKFLKNSC